MTPPLTTSVVWTELRGQIERVHGWLDGRIAPALGYSADVIRDRLTQRVLELSMVPFAVAARQRGNAAPAGWLQCPGVVVHADGRARLPLRDILSHEIEFVLHWLYCLSAILLPSRAALDRAAAVLVHDLADENLFREHSDAAFVEYSSRGPIAPFRTAPRLFIESLSGNVSTVPDRFTYCRRPLVALTRQSRLGIAGRARLFVSQLLLFWRFHFSAVRTPLLWLVARDAAYVTLSQGLDARGLIDAIVLTCVSWGWQPLWMRSLRARLHMIWYSQSPQAVAYESDARLADGPRLPWTRVDTHWVWTPALAGYLREQGHRGDVAIVGPIVWQLPETRRRSDAELRLLVFDVPAVSDETMLLAAGEVTNYYHPDKLRAFIADIVSLRQPLEARFRKPVVIELKMKRGHRPHYARDAADYVEALAREGALILAPTEDNIFALVSASHLVISYPFTSPAYLAEALGVPAMFYDSTATIRRHDFCASPATLAFVSGREQLLAVASNLLEQPMPTRSAANG